jgi:hypothetical protein
MCVHPHSYPCHWASRQLLHAQKIASDMYCYTTTMLCWDCW